MKLSINNQAQCLLKNQRSAVRYPVRLLSFVSLSAESRRVTGESMCTLVLVNCLGGLSLPGISGVTLTDRPDITMPWTYLATKLTVEKRRVSIDALRNLKTTPCQQLPYHHFVSAALLCSTDDLPLKSEAHCYTKRHAKIML